MPNVIAYPLTYRETDAAGALTWVRQGAGPHVTPLGFEGDGYEARYRATSLPAWLSSATAALTLHASIRPYPQRIKGAKDTIIHVGDNTNPKLGLFVLADPANANWVYTALQGYAGGVQSMPVARPQWRYRLRFPSLSVGGYKARPQGIHFLDASTLLLTAHYEDTLSRCYKLTPAGAVLGYFDFNPTLQSGHINSIAQAADGSVWFAGSQKFFRVDLAASFAAQSAVVTATYTTPDIASFMAIATIGGSEYVLCGKYLETGTPYLYVFPFALMVEGGTFDIASRTKRFVIEQRMQGIVFHGGKLYMAMNRMTGESGSIGRLRRYTLDLSAADGSTLVAETEWPAPSGYPEDIAVDPGTGELWSPTEGWAAVGDWDGFLGVWSSTLTGEAEENHVTAEFDGGANVTLKLNGQAFQTAAWSINQVVSAVSVGGPPQASPGMVGGFLIGNVRNIVIQDEALSTDAYQAAVSGAHEPYALTAYALSLTNPGAESGAAGWTNDVGSIATRTSNPAAYAGSAYFTGGANAQTISRQRLDVLAQTALQGGDIDAGAIWAKVRWKQSSFDSAQDPGGMGIRLLDAAQAQLGLTYSGLAYVPNCANGGPHYWYPRCLSLPVAAGSRYVDAVFRADRSSGTNNDHYVDDISMVLYRQVPTGRGWASTSGPLGAMAGSLAIVVPAAALLEGPLGAATLVALNGAEAVESLLVLNGPLGDGAAQARPVVVASGALAGLLGGALSVARVVCTATMAVFGPLGNVSGLATVLRYELRGEVRDDGALVNRTVRAYRRDTGALAGSVETEMGRFVIPVGFGPDEYVVIPIDLSPAAADFAPPCANRVLSVLAQD